MKRPLLVLDEENKLLIINDGIESNYKVLLIVVFLNILSCIINISRLYKEEFNLIHGVWILNGLLSVFSIVLFFRNNYSKTIPVNEIKYYKVNSFWGNKRLELYIKNERKRNVVIATKKTLVQIEDVLKEINIVRYDD